MGPGAWALLPAPAQPGQVGKPPSVVWLPRGNRVGVHIRREQGLGLPPFPTGPSATVSARWSGPHPFPPNWLPTCTVLRELALLDLVGEGDRMSPTPTGLRVWHPMGVGRTLEEDKDQTRSEGGRGTHIWGEERGIPFRERERVPHIWGEGHPIVREGIYHR